MTAAAPLALLFLAVSAGAASFEALAAKADKALKHGESAAALEYYTSALAVWHKSDGAKAKSKVLRARAETLERAGNFEPALADLAAALKLEPKSGALYRRRGELYLRLNKASAAISDFYKAASIDLSDREAYFGRGVAYELQGDLQFAHEDFRTACRLGMKKACGNAAEAKKRLLRPLADSPLEFERTEQERNRPVEIRKAKAPKRRYTLDFEACLSGLDACLEEGDAFGVCVRKAHACEKAPAKGCCPAACLKQYERLAAGEQSEAQAYRTVFQPKAACTAP